MQGSLALPRLRARPQPAAAPPASRRERQPRDAARKGKGRLGEAYAAARTWLRRAYADTTSPEHAQLAEALILTVIVSTTATVLEFDPWVAGQYDGALFALDTMVTACFMADYALNLRYARSWRRYAFGPWGIIDLLAILPVAHWLLVPQLGKTLRFLRFLRFLRVLKAAKDLRRRFELTQSDVPESVALSYEVFLVVAVPATLLLSDLTTRGVALGAVLLAALTLCFRQWLVKARHDAAALLVLLATIAFSVQVALRLDESGNALLAVVVVLGAVATSLVSWLRIELAAER
ncbi:MAG TPA: ion transporter [Chloroflexota bacterium]|nr:ion transporter [Chloroflexota bacterium]